MKFNDTDIDTAARTLWGECRGEPKAGQVAVAWVIRNRAERRRFAGDTAGQPGAVDRVCKAKWQFSCWWDDQAPRLRALSAAQAEPYARIVREVLEDAVADPTNGGDHYHTIAKPGYADVWPPNWAPTMKEVARFGGHVFYDSRLPPGAKPLPAAEENKPALQSKSVIAGGVTVAAGAASVADQISQLQPTIDAISAFGLSVQSLLKLGAVALSIVALAAGAYFLIRYLKKRKNGEVVST